MRRVTLGTLVLTIAASSLLATSHADAAVQPVPNWQRITIRPLTQQQKIDTWGLDLKNRAQVAQFAENPAFARRVVADHRMNVVRITIRTDTRAVDASGHLIEAYYADTIGAVRNVRLGNPQVRILASRRTITDCPEYHDTRCPDFAPSLKVDGQVSTVRYGRLVVEYLLFLRRSGLVVNYLSLDNEPPNNEGNLTPDRFAEVAGVVRRNYPSPMPVLAGNDNVYADSRWLQAAPGSVQIASSHSNSRWYPDQSPVMRRFAAVAKKRGMRLWNTEMHWNDNTPKAVYVNAAKALLSFFDHTDAGYSGFFWWGWQQDGDKGLLWRAYIKSTIGARPILVTDKDGTAAARGALVTRAYRSGNTVYLWVLNDSARTVWNQRIFGSQSYRPTLNVWHQSGTRLVHTQQVAQRMNNQPTYSFRPHTISMVSLALIR
jgi:O-glycosyl hydrolase